ncbi:hypothetical protein Tco_1549045 [Tanacetum coccineum]
MEKLSFDLNVRKESSGSNEAAQYVETDDPFDDLDEVLGYYANTGKEIIVHVGNSPTIKILVDCEMLYETEGVGPMRNFKEVEDLDYDPKHDELYDDDEHILKDVLVSINNFNFNPKSKHDLNIAAVEVPEHDPDVIDYDSFGSDLDDEIDSDKELNLQN